jgi:geranylgeranyl diphosphate synthase type II
MDLISLKAFDKSEKIEKVKNIYIESGVLEFSKQKKEEYYQKSMHALDQLSVDDESKESLRFIANKMMERKN